MNNKYLFDEFVIKESSIGIYSIPKIRDGRNIDEIINEIFNNGIIINWGGITNDFNFLGKKEESTYFEASDYNGFLYECNIVISIPQVIDNYFIGNIPRTINIKNEIDSEYHKIIKFNPVNKYVVENNKFPKELIVGAIKDNEFIKNINYNKNEILNKLIKYDLINLNEDIESINLKLNRSIAMEQNLNLDGYSSYIKQALEYKKEEM